MRDFLLILIGINIGLGIGAFISPQLCAELADLFGVPDYQRW